MGNPINIAGERHGKLVAIEPTTRHYQGSVIWKCRCDCGNDFYVPCSKFRAGRSISCGCIRPSVYRMKVAPVIPQCMFIPVDRDAFNDDWMFRPI